jgi:MFS family permease
MAGDADVPSRLNSGSWPFGYRTCMAPGAERGEGLGSPARRRSPWYVALFFGSEPLDSGTLRVLGLVSVGLFFENYDIGLVNAALPQIAGELDIPAGDTGYYLSAIRLGGIGACLILPFADLAGRRRVFLAALLGMSLGTMATAVSQTPVQFAAAQMITRAFLLTASAVGLVILIEELPAHRRGAGLSMLAVLGGLGFGLASGLYAAVDRLPFGWRALYAIGFAPVLLLPFLRRSLRETARFEQHRLHRGDAKVAFRSWLDPVKTLVRTHPRRVAAVGLAGLLAAMGGIAFFQYTSYFVQAVHGWSPGQFTLLVIGGGLIGVGGSFLGGRGSDRFGRRRVGFWSLLFVPAFVALFFNGPALLLPLAWGLAVLCNSAGDLVIRALSAELFDTSHRSTAAGWLMLVQTLGWTVGLLGVGLATESLQDLAHAVSWVALASMAAAACILWVPETRRRELEAISEVP